MKVVKLPVRDKAKFHIGDYRGRLKESFSSDQLFSAIINNLSLLASPEEIEDTITLFKNNKICISSIFYGLDICAKNNSEEIINLYFLPKPKADISSNHDQEAELFQRKKLKKVAYLSIDVYKDLLSTWSEKEKKFDYDLLKLIFIGDKFVCTKRELEYFKIDDKLRDKLAKTKILKMNSIPGISINRKTSESEDFFYQDYMELNYVEMDKYIIKPFMYFLYKGKLTNKLKTAFNLIAEEGIGGKRSRGMGCFEGVEEFEGKMFNRFNTDGSYYLNISSYYPQKEEVNDILNYQLEKKDGYIYSNGGQAYRKKGVRMIREGSVFSAPVKGQLLNVTPKYFKQHEVYLNGKSFLLGFGGDK